VCRERERERERQCTRSLTFEGLVLEAFAAPDTGNGAMLLAAVRE